MACFIDKDNKKTIIDDCVTRVMKDLCIKGVSAITDDGKMTLYSDVNFYEYENLDDETILFALLGATNKSLTFLLKDLDKLNPNINPEFFCIECTCENAGIYQYEIYNTVEKLIPEMEKSLKYYESLPRYYADKTKLLKEKITYVKTLDPSTPSTYEMYEMHKLCNVSECNNIGPYFSDGRDSVGAWMMTLPPRVNAQTLADIIRKTFIGIGGILDEVQGNKSIFFMQEGYSCNDDWNDYSHCVSYEINHQALVDNYYRPKTIGEYLKEEHVEYKRGTPCDCYGNIIKKNPRYAFTDYYSDDVLEHLKDKKEDDPEWCEKFDKLMEKEYERKEWFPLNTSKEGIVATHEFELKDLIERKKLFDGYSEEEKNKVANTWYYYDLDEKIFKAKLDLEEALKDPVGYFYINEAFCGIQYMVGVPFDIQVEACAIVAGVTPSEMIVKLNKASGK